MGYSHRVLSPVSRNRDSSASVGGGAQWRDSHITRILHLMNYSAFHRTEM